jgi:glycosyltransferase involved in cell wall biosynthesis
MLTNVFRASQFPARLEAMRLAFFSPLAPVRSGISAYAAELLPHLTARHTVDVYVEDAVWRAYPDERAHGARVCRAHDFIHRQVLEPYDLIVYQLGNATCHDYMWPYLMRYPGLVVLHDGQLHHARARALLRRDRKADYRDEFRYAHPDANPDIAEFVVAGLQGPVYYIWPLVAAAIRRARLVAVHNPRLAAELRESFPDAAIETIRMGVTDPGDFDEQRRADETPMTFAAFGLVTPEKRIPQILRALRVAPGARLRLVGETAPHYDVRADAERFGVADRVDVTGYVPDEALAAELRRCDVCLCLRWPTTRETSATWLRCLAAGKATVINDLTHLVDIPTLDPRSWTVLDARTDAAAAARRPRPEEAVAVSIDILDEDHSLELAMRRLAGDPALRASLGVAARRHYEAQHTLPRMADDYERLLAQAIALPAPDPAAIALPPHLLDDHSGRLRRLLAETGMPESLL